MFACLSNLKQSCSKFYKEQKLFYDQLMKMCTTCSKRSHKSELGLDSTLRNFLSLDVDFQFLVPLFGALYLPNLTESAQVPIGKVVVLTSISNFVNLT